MNRRMVPTAPEGLRLCRRYTHTHTHLASGRVVRVQMRWRWTWKMRWEWRWDDSYLTRARRGERKRRGKEQTHTNTPSPERANPEKAREEKKVEADGHGPRPAEGGEDGSAWTNLTQRKPTQTSARDGPDLPGEGRTHEIGDQWGTSWWKKTKQGKKDSAPLNLKVVRCSLAGTVVRSAPGA